MPNDEDDDEFVDPNDYQGSKEQGVSFNQIILQHIRRCVEQASKPMTMGYFKQVQTKSGSKEVYVEDQREVYINCIKTFYDVMIPFFDKEFMQDDVKLNKELEKIEEDMINMLKAKREYAVKNNLEKLRDQLDYNIATKHVDMDSFEAKQAYDAKIVAYRLMFQSLIKLYMRTVGEGADISD